MAFWNMTEGLKRHALFLSVNNVQGTFYFRYVDSFVEEGVDYEEFRALVMRTRIYSDAWAAYGTREIEQMGFKHHRVIHQNRGGRFHTNSIES